MRIQNSLVKRAVIVLALFGALSVGVVGISGAAGAATTTPKPASAAATHNRALFCSMAQKRHVPKRRTGAGFAKQASKVGAKSAKAQTAGHKKRAAWLSKIASQDKKNSSRLGTRRAKMEARLQAEVAKLCGTSH